MLFRGFQGFSKFFKNFQLTRGFFNRSQGFSIDETENEVGYTDITILDRERCGFQGFFCPTGFPLPAILLCMVPNVLDAFLAKCITIS